MVESAVAGHGQHRGAFAQHGPGLLSIQRALGDQVGQRACPGVVLLHDPGEAVHRADVEEVAVEAAIRKVVSPETFVYSGDEALDGVASALDQVIAVITIIAWIVVVVSAVTLLNTLMLSVLDRRREIGVLRAIGATRAFTLKAILAEAAGIGIVGAVLGLVLGAAIQYLTSVALTNVLSIDVAWQPSPSMILIGLGALAICLLGSVPPAVRAARLDIVSAISAD